MSGSPRIPVLLAALGTAVWLAASAQAAPRATCHGFAVTIAKSSGHVVGTPKRDVIRLTGPGTVRALGGNDIICGSRFQDVIHAGPGNDVVVSGRGHDRIFGGPGNDNLFGEGGNDHVDGGPGRDMMAGGAGRNRYAPVRKVAKSEDGLAVPGDTIVRATRAVSLITTPSDVASLLRSGGGFGFAWSPPAIPQATATTPVWAAMQPMVNNWLGIPDLVAVYWGQVPFGQPGAFIRPAQTGYTTFGRAWTLQPRFAGEPSLEPATSNPAGALPNTVTLSAGNINPGPYTAGLAMDANGSGGAARGLAPAQAVGINPFQQVSLPQPSVLRVWAGSPVRQPGELIDADLPMGQETAVQFTSAQPTAMLRYSAAQGFIP